MLELCIETWVNWHYTSDWLQQCFMCPPSLFLSHTLGCVKRQSWLAEHVIDEPMVLNKRNVFLTPEFLIACIYFNIFTFYIATKPTTVSIRTGLTKQVVAELYQLMTSHQYRKKHPFQRVKTQPDLKTRWHRNEMVVLENMCSQQLASSFFPPSSFLSHGYLQKMQKDVLASTSEADRIGIGLITVKKIWGLRFLKIGSIIILEWGDIPYLEMLRKEMHAFNVVLYSLFPLTLIYKGSTLCQVWASHWRVDYLKI